MKLIIGDDSKEYIMLIRRMLASVIPDIEVTEYDPEQQGRPSDEFDWGIYDVLLIDYQLGVRENGLEWIEQFRRAPRFPPVILMTSTGDEYVAASAIKLGASDFIKLKTPYRDGTTHVIFEPVDFIAKLAALVPKPRVNLTRFHGVFAANSKHRALVTPAKWGKGRKKSKTSALLKSRGRSVADTGDLTRAMTFCGLSRCYRLLGINGDFCGT